MNWAPGSAWWHTFVVYESVLLSQVSEVISQLVQQAQKIVQIWKPEDLEFSIDFTEKVSDDDWE